MEFRAKVDDPRWRRMLSDTPSSGVMKLEVVAVKIRLTERFSH